MRVTGIGAGGRPTGIVSYGHYIPPMRMDIGTLADQWDIAARHERMIRLNGRNAVAVNARDEDATTLAIAAAEHALAGLAEEAPRPCSVVVGSESHVYAVKPTAVIVAEALDMPPNVFAMDVQFACKSGTAAMLSCAAMVEAGYAEAALAIGSDCPQSAPGSLLEASVGSAAASFVIGRDRVVAAIDAIASAASDVTDFWRRDTETYPRVAGRYSVDIGYVAHTARVLQALLDATGTKPPDYRFACLHQPYSSLPMAVAREFGFARHQLETGIVAGRIGNAYSASCLLSLCAALDAAAAGDRVIVVSFGSGAGSDGFCLTVRPEIEDLRARLGKHERVADSASSANADLLTYGAYAASQGKLRR